MARIKTQTNPKTSSNKNQKKPLPQKRRLHRYRYHIGTALALLLSGLVLLGIFGTPRKTEADSTLGSLLFTPFGGQIIYAGPATSPACHALTAAISIASLGTINVLINEVVVGGPSPTSVGMVTIDGIPIPGLQKVYDYKNFTPKTNVVGLSLNLCNVCGKTAKKIPGAQEICKTKNIDKIINGACKVAATACKPATNLLYSIGTGSGPSSVNLGL